MKKLLLLILILLITGCKEYNRDNKCIEIHNAEYVESECLNDL